MGEKLAVVDDPILKFKDDESVPVGDVWFISPRRYRIAGPRGTVDGDGFTAYLPMELEPESEWLKRCAVIRNVGKVAG